MPRSIDYSKTIIYKLCCKDTNITDIYVGATTCMKARKSQHKNCCNKENTTGYNCKVYKFIRDNGGFSNFDMIMVEKYPCKDKLESDKRERYWLEELGATLNKNIPSRTGKEYKKEYRQNNKKYWKEYRQNNTDKLTGYHKEYKKNNKEKIREYRKNPYTCITCNKTMTKGNKYKHEKTKKHLQNLNTE